MTSERSGDLLKGGATKYLWIYLTLLPCLPNIVLADACTAPPMCKAPVQILSTHWIPSTVARMDTVNYPHVPSEKGDPEQRSSSPRITDPTHGEVVIQTWLCGSSYLTLGLCVTVWNRVMILSFLWWLWSVIYVKRRAEHQACAKCSVKGLCACDTSGRSSWHPGKHVHLSVWAELLFRDFHPLVCARRTPGTNPSSLHILLEPLPFSLGFGVEKKIWIKRHMASVCGN